MPETPHVSTPPPSPGLPVQALDELVARIVQRTRATDMHTHLFAPSFGSLLLCGADELLNFHYIVAESFRAHHLPYSEFRHMSRASRSDLIWESLFVQRSPLSEATSGVLEIGQALGVDLRLDALREALCDVPTETYVTRVLDLAGVDSVVMTNDPLDPVERAVWERSPAMHPRFHAALRLDRLLNHYQAVVPELCSLGYAVRDTLDAQTVLELRRFLDHWLERMGALYVAFSAGDDFSFPGESTREQLLERVILPVCLARELPLALMIGSRRQVNQDLGDAGDSLGRASMLPIEALCSRYPDQRFFVTVLSRESQHELVVTARKFHNLMIFGCWWFVNTDSLVTEITRMRLELLGPTFIPQHSDARVLEQVIYKWQRARHVIARLLGDRYRRLIEMGWTVREDDIERDVRALLNDNFWGFIRRA
ncbi:MAG: glucuronate isomerase [Firmicutes bacterium]|nr:glucuronate isomerase [Bacillota bacterium]